MRRCGLKIDGHEEKKKPQRAQNYLRRLNTQTRVADFTRPSGRELINNSWLGLNVAKSGSFWRFIKSLTAVVAGL